MHLSYNVELLCGLYDVEACDNMVVVVVALWQNILLNRIQMYVIMNVVVGSLRGVNPSVLSIIL